MVALDFLPSADAVVLEKSCVILSLVLEAVTDRCRKASATSGAIEKLTALFDPVCDRFLKLCSSYSVCLKAVKAFVEVLGFSR